MEILISCLTAWEMATKVLNRSDLTHDTKIEIIRELDYSSGNQCNFNHIAGYP